MITDFYWNEVNYDVNTIHRNGVPLNGWFWGQYFTARDACYLECGIFDSEYWGNQPWKFNHYSLGELIGHQISTEPVKWNVYVNSGLVEIQEIYPHNLYRFSGVRVSCDKEINLDEALPSHLFGYSESFEVNCPLAVGNIFGLPDLPAYNNMWMGCRTLTGDPSTLEYNRAASNFVSMYNGCRNLTGSAYIPNTDIVSTIDCSNMYNYCRNLSGVGSYDNLFRLDRCDSMFYECINYASIPYLPNGDCNSMYVNVQKANPEEKILISQITASIKNCYRTFWKANLSNMGFLLTNIGTAVDMFNRANPWFIQIEGPMFSTQDLTNFCDNTTLLIDSTFATHVTDTNILGSLDNYKLEELSVPVLVTDVMGPEYVESYDRSLSVQRNTEVKKYQQTSFIYKYSSLPGTAKNLTVYSSSRLV